MRGLSRIPATDDLARAYAFLLEANSDSDLTQEKLYDTEEIALWVQWVRIDPRLGEILVLFFSMHWKKIDLFRFRAGLLSQAWPQAFGVLTESALAGKLVKFSERGLFRKWSEVILAGVKAADGELFFIRYRRIGGKESLADAVGSSKAYLKWGYFGRDLLVNKAASLSRPTTQLPPSSRKRLLGVLLSERERITARDYREALGNRVSVRQAEIDLQNEKRLVAVGNTRARFYRVRKKQNNRSKK